MKKYSRCVGHSILSRPYDPTCSFVSLFKDSRGKFINYRLHSLVRLCKYSAKKFYHCNTNESCHVPIPLDDLDILSPAPILEKILDCVRVYLLNIDITSISLYTDGKIVAHRSPLTII